MDGMGIGHSHDTGAMAVTSSVPEAPVEWPSTYFSYPEYTELLMAHIVLMTIAWIFILPISVMLSIARSRLSSFLQLFFLSVNALGLLLGTIYNARTPDLYESNVHHTYGWVVTWIACVQALVGVVRSFRGAGRVRKVEPTPKYLQAEDPRAAERYRYSRDSGIESPGMESPSSLDEPLYAKEEIATSDDQSLDEMPEEIHHLLESNIANGFLTRSVQAVARSRAMRYIGWLYGVIDRLLLMLGFIALCTGILTSGGYFKGSYIFSGLAHFVKGGIFMWYGLFTLGRVMGCFADLGWAWNVKPPATIVGSRKAATPSAEFIESLLIFTYGSTNMFLERLNAKGPEWGSVDLEHVSISIMFFGGGLCGMLVESTWIRSLINQALISTISDNAFASSSELWQEPLSYGISLNPLPGIMLLLLGMMMSSHHQESMTSTMLHKQWGTLFVGAAFARGATYILLYISPPASYLPSRPPSEFVVSFCLIAGGLLFMGSNSDFVLGMEHYQLDAMFLFTVMMGLTAFIMAWTIVVLVVKGWAVQRQHTGPFNSANRV